MVLGTELTSMPAGHMRFGWDPKVVHMSLENEIIWIVVPFQSVLRSSKDRMVSTSYEIVWRTSE